MKYLCRYRTPEAFSDIIIAGEGEYLTGLWFEGSRDALRTSAEYREGRLPVFTETERWLDVYFSGAEPDFTPPYRIEGLTEFRRAVTGRMLAIPYGKTVTYGEIAAAIAKERGIQRMSAQAVGQAVGKNPLCILIPCHRVMGADGALTGYGGGIGNKIALLRLEGHDTGSFFLPR